MKKTLFLLFFLFIMPSHVFGQEDLFYTVDEKQITYQEVISRPKTVIMLWATWCFYCKKELARLNTDPIKNKSIAIFYVNLGDKPNTVKKFVNATKLNQAITQNILLDKTGFMADKFSVIGIPTYLFFKNGKLIHRGYSINDDVLSDIFDHE